jgi:translocation and assembly module TamB
MLEGPQQTNQASNNIAGNVSVNYQLTEDGRYMVRFYRLNEYEGMLQGYVIETGLSFQVRVDYNRFRQIFQDRRARKEAKREERKQANKEKEEQEQKQKETLPDNQQVQPANNTQKEKNQTNNEGKKG